MAPHVKDPMVTPTMYIDVTSSTRNSLPQTRSN